MLTKIEGSRAGHGWVELATVTAVSGDDAGCMIWFPGCSNGMVFSLAAQDMVTMVSEAKAKAKVYGYVGDSAAADLKPAPEGVTIDQLIRGKWKSRQVAMQDILVMIEALDQHPQTGPWSGLVGWLQKEIKVAERKQAETEQDQPEVQKPGGN